MKQVLQSLKDGRTEVTDVPSPGRSAGHLLIRTSRTLISAGTERMVVDFGRANLVDKARQQPDKVRVALEKARTDGLLPTIEAIRNKLDQPLALGYCNVGVVEAVGDGVLGFAVGDRVVSNGKHAQMVSVPVNLCAKVPDNVQDEHAPFAVLGAIALQGIRLATPTLGESVVVTGLGLIGLLTVQLLRAHGCRVLGIDPDPVKIALARSFGAETVQLGDAVDPVQAAQVFSRGRGVDAVLITAATDSNEPVHHAALMCRQRGRIVLVGVAGLDLVRDDFYKKELLLQVSSSYGPGRYDPTYEEKGHDYPIGFVRWTAQRNIEAVLDLMASGSLDVAPLITHRFAVSDAADAYNLMSGGPASLGIILEYPEDHAAAARHIELRSAGTERRGGASTPAVSFIGAGNFATAVLMPAFRAAGATLVTVASNGGASGVYAGKKYGFLRTTTDTASVLAEQDSNVVVIATRHNSHARLVVQALEAGKSVFVEKPLCLTHEELDQIASVLERVEQHREAAPRLMVGFNRRFAPQISRMRELLASTSGPKAMVMTVNAGAIPADHWTQDPEIGGGRILGEGCHFIDLLRHLADAPISEWHRLGMHVSTRDSASIQFAFADGSIGTVHYFANGSRAFPKERLEIFVDGRVLQLDNFRTLRAYGWPGFTSMRLWRQDKGQRACAAAFVRSVAEGGPSPIPLRELLEVSRVSLEVSDH